MLKKDIKVGGYYTALVSGKVTTVRVDAVRESKDYGPRAKSFNLYDCTNLTTGRKVTFRSAARFRKEVPDPAEGKQSPDPTKAPAKEITTAFAAESHSSTATARTVERPITATKMTNPTGLLGKIKVDTDKSPHVIVKARAGTGKTFTLVTGVIQMFMDRVPGLWDMLVGKLGFAPVPSPQQAAVWDSMRLSGRYANNVRFAAFNNSIVEEFNHKWGWVCAELRNYGIQFSFSTMHSLGNGACYKAFSRLGAPNKDRGQELIAELLGKDIWELRKKKLATLDATTQLVSKCKMNLIGPGPGEDPAAFDWTGELDDLCRHYDVELEGNRAEVFDLVPKVLERSKQVTPGDRLAFDDMIWLPVVLDLPVTRFDVLLIDESQDLNRCQQELARRAGKRLILVGDEKQAIYGFAGADAESMERMEGELKGKCERCGGVGFLEPVSEWSNNPCPACLGGVKPGSRGVSVLPLTVTRRCGKAVVREAQKIVPDFEAHEDNGEGRITRARFPVKNEPETPTPGSRPVYTTLVADSDMILCRVNAPLVSECFKFIRAGRKANVLGRNIAEGLVAAVKKHWKKAADGSGPDVLSFGRNLSDWLADETRKEQAQKFPSESRLIGFQDKFDCLMCFAGEADVNTTMEGVITKITSLFAEARDRDGKPIPGIRLSSIHKAKGLEADRVFLLEPEGAGVPHPMAKKEWAVKQEWNLRYVAITRAIKELVFVS